MTDITIHEQSDGGFWTAVVGAIAAVLGGVVAGFWQYFGNRKKHDAEASKIGLDAQASVMNGFTLLLNEFRTEREQLVQRLSELETHNLRLDRRVLQLERCLVHNGIEVPAEES